MMLVEVDAVEIDAVEVDAVEVDAVEIDAVEVQQLMCLVRAVCHWHSVFGNYSCHSANSQTHTHTASFHTNITEWNENVANKRQAACSMSLNTQELHIILAAQRSRHQ